jgi:hypothetical protein
VAPDTQRRRDYLDEQLFPIEKSSGAGKALLAALQCSSDAHYAEFLPEGLSQTYRDKKTGLDLPVFAVFPLQKETDSIFYRIQYPKRPDDSDHPEVSFHWALQCSQSFSELRPYVLPSATTRSLMRRNKRAHAFAWIKHIAFFSLLFATVYGCLFLLLRSHRVLPLAVVNNWICMVAFSLDSRPRPRKEGLQLNATFSGLLPKSAREKAVKAAEEFTDLFLVVDQRGRWESELLPSPQPADPDPLLIGARKVNHSWRYYLIGVFDLTDAEQYLQDEFCENPGA